MSVVNGALANQTTFNNAFVSRTALTTSTVATLSLLKPSLTAVASAQVLLLELAEVSGQAEGASVVAKEYGSTNVVADGDSRKVAIGKLDVVVGDHAARIAAEEVISTDHENRITTAEVKIATLESSGGGGGGGGSLVWIAPEGRGAEVRQEHGGNVAVFNPQISGEEQYIEAFLAIPLGYTIGNQIRIAVPNYSPESGADRWAFETSATLVQAGEAISVTANVKTDLTGDFDGLSGVDFLWRDINDLTEVDGKINTVPVQQGHWLKLKMTRLPPATGTESVEEVKIPLGAIEVYFS